MIITDAGAFILALTGGLGLLGMVCVFLIARHNDRLDGPDFW